MDAAEWPCPDCTYLNKDSYDACEMCGKVRDVDTGNPYNNNSNNNNNTIDTDLLQLANIPLSGMDEDKGIGNKNEKDVESSSIAASADGMPESIEGDDDDVDDDDDDDDDQSISENVEQKDKFNINPPKNPSILTTKNNNNRGNPSTPPKNALDNKRKLSPKNEKLTKKKIDYESNNNNNTTTTVTADDANQASGAVSATATDGGAPVDEVLAKQRSFYNKMRNVALRGDKIFWTEGSEVIELACQNMANDPEARRFAIDCIALLIAKYIDLEISINRGRNKTWDVLRAEWERSGEEDLKRYTHAFEVAVLSSLKASMYFFNSDSLEMFDLLCNILDPNKPLFHPQGKCDYRAVYNPSTDPDEGAREIYEAGVNHFFQEGGYDRILKNISEGKFSSHPHLIGEYIRPVLLTKKSLPRLFGSEEKAAAYLIELSQTCCSKLESIPLEVIANEEKYKLKLAIEHISCLSLLPWRGDLDTFTSPYGAREALTAAAAAAATLGGGSSSSAAAPYPVPDHSQGLGTFKKIVLNCFHSHRLKLRRSGLELIGELAKYQIYSLNRPKQEVTDWLKKEHVFEDIFGDRMDERVVSCADDLLRFVEIDHDIIKMFLARAGSSSVQRLLSMLSSSFSDEMMFALLNGATERVLRERDSGSLSLIRAALVGEKDIRYLLRRNQRAAFAALKALWAVLIFDLSLPESSQTDIINAFTSILGEVGGREHRRYFINECAKIIHRFSFKEGEASAATELSLPLFTEDFELYSDPELVMLPPLPQGGASITIVYTVLQSVIGTFPELVKEHSHFSHLPMALPPTSPKSATESNRPRSTVIRQLYDSCGVYNMIFKETELFLNENVKEPTKIISDGLDARLNLVSYLAKYGEDEEISLTLPLIETFWSLCCAPSAPIENDSIRSLFRESEKNKKGDNEQIIKQNRGNDLTQEIFLFWLRTCSCTGVRSQIRSSVLKAILNELFVPSRINILSLGPRAYQCLQGLFVEVNIKFGNMNAADSEQFDPSLRHCKRAPSEAYSGMKMVGHRVRILCNDKILHEGKIISYRPSWNRHTVEYLNGRVEEVSVEDLDECIILPPAELSQAGNVNVREVRSPNLQGLKTLWAVALYSKTDSPSTKACELLFALFKKMAAIPIIMAVPKSQSPGGATVATATVNSNTAGNVDDVTSPHSKGKELSQANGEGDDGFNSEHEKFALTNPILSDTVDYQRFFNDINGIPMYEWVKAHIIKLYSSSNHGSDPSDPAMSFVRIRYNGTGIDTTTDDISLKDLISTGITPEGVSTSRIYHAGYWTSSNIPNGRYGIRDRSLDLVGVRRNCDYRDEFFSIIQRELHSSQDRLSSSVNGLSSDMPFGLLMKDVSKTIFRCLSLLRRFLHDPSTENLHNDAEIGHEINVLVELITNHISTSSSSGLNDGRDEDDAPKPKVSSSSRRAKMVFHSKMQYHELVSQIASHFDIPDAASLEIYFERVDDFEGGAISREASLSLAKLDKTVAKCTLEELGLMGMKNVDVVITALAKKHENHDQQQQQQQQQASNSQQVVPYVPKSDTQAVKPEPLSGKSNVPAKKSNEKGQKSSKDGSHKHSLFTNQEFLNMLISLLKLPLTAPARLALWEFLQGLPSTNRRKGSEGGDNIPTTLALESTLSGDVDEKSIWSNLYNIYMSEASSLDLNLSDQNKDSSLVSNMMGSTVSLSKVLHQYMEQPGTPSSTSLSPTGGSSQTNNDTEVLLICGMIASMRTLKLSMASSLGVPFTPYGTLNQDIQGSSKAVDEEGNVLDLIKSLIFLINTSHRCLYTSRFFMCTGLCGVQPFSSKFSSGAFSGPSNNPSRQKDSQQSSSSSSSSNESGSKGSMFAGVADVFRKRSEAEGLSNPQLSSSQEITSENELSNGLPPTVLCNSCQRVRRFIRSILDAIESLKLLFINFPEFLDQFLGLSGKSLFDEKEGVNADNILFDLLLGSAVRVVRRSMKDFVQACSRISEPFANHMFKLLISLEQRLELEQGSFTCDEFFEVLSLFFDTKGLQKSITDPNQGGEHDEIEKSEISMIQRLFALISAWRHRKPLTKEPKSETRLFVGFVSLLEKLVTEFPHLLEPSKVKAFINELWNHFLMDVNPAQPFCDSKESRAAVCGLIKALSKTDDHSLLLTFSLFDDFLSKTPVPLKRKERGWEFEPDWQFDPSSYENGGIRLRNSTNHVGLLSRGSTCYLNSLLQLLFAVDDFRNIILAAPTKAPRTVIKKKKAVVENKGVETDKQAVAEQTKADSIPIGWRCWCSGVNDLNSQICHLCETPMPPDPETVFESFSSPAGGASASSEQVVEQEEVVGDDNGEGEVVLADDADESNMEILRQLQRTFMFLHHGRQNYYDPYELVQACRKLNLQFPVTSQNDASEFYDKLLDSLEKSLKESPQLRELNRLFAGQQIRLKKCNNCGKESVSREESFYRLELMVRDDTIVKKSLAECLATLTAPEELTGDNKVECDHCKEKTPTTFRSYLTKLPDFLFIHPKRFTFDLNSMQTVKLNHFVSFPHVLDLSPYTNEELSNLVEKQANNESNETEKLQSASSEIGNTMDTPDYDAARDKSAKSIENSPAAHEEDLSVSKKKKKMNTSYRLKGVLVHRGRAGGGHYYSFVKYDEAVDADASGNPKHNWFLFNDDRVSMFDEDELSKECFGGEHERSITYRHGYTRSETVEKEWNAFMLLYHRDEEQEIKEDNELANDPLLLADKKQKIQPRSLPEESNRSSKQMRLTGNNDIGDERSNAKTREELGGDDISHPMHVKLIKENSSMGPEWEVEKVRTSMLNEVRFANTTISRQALLYDPLISKMALDVLLENREQLLKTNKDDANIIVQTVLKLYLCVALRSAAIVSSSADPAVIESWKSIIEILLEEFYKPSEDIIALLARNGGSSYLSEGDEYDQQSPSNQMQDSGIVSIDVNKARPYRVKYIGIPLLETLTLTLELLDCPSRVPRTSVIELLSCMVKSLVNKTPQGESKPTTSTEMKLSNDAIMTLNQALIEILPHACVTVSRFATYCSLWYSLSQIEYFRKLNVSGDTIAFLIHLTLGQKSPGVDLSDKVESQIKLNDLSQLFSVSLANVSGNGGTHTKTSSTGTLVMDNGVVLDQASLFNEKIEDNENGKEIYEKSRSKLMSTISHLIRQAQIDGVKLSNLTSSMLMHDEFRSMLISSMSTFEEAGHMLVLLCFGNAAKLDQLYNELSLKLYDLSATGATNTVTPSRACESCLQSLLLSDPPKLIERLSDLLRTARDEITESEISMKIESIVAKPIAGVEAVSTNDDAATGSGQAQESIDSEVTFLENLQNEESITLLNRRGRPVYIRRVLHVFSCIVLNGTSFNMSSSSTIINSIVSDPDKKYAKVKDILLKTVNYWVPLVDWLAFASSPTNQFSNIVMLDSEATAKLMKDLLAFKSIVKMLTRPSDSPLKSHHIESLDLREELKDPQLYVLEVSGAGYAKINGVYQYSGEYLGYPKWSLKVQSNYRDTFEEFIISRVVLPNDKHVWMISEISGMASSTYVYEYYSTKEFNKTSTMRIPLSQTWAKRQLGSTPSPTVRKVFLAQTNKMVSSNNQEAEFIDANVREAHEIDTMGVE